MVSARPTDAGHKAGRAAGPPEHSPCATRRPDGSSAAVNSGCNPTDRRTSPTGHRPASASADTPPGPWFCCCSTATPSGSLASSHMLPLTTWPPAGYQRRPDSAALARSPMTTARSWSDASGVPTARARRKGQVRRAAGELACRPGSVTRSRGSAAIHLGLSLPAASCGLPASSGGPPSIARAGAVPLSRRRALLTLLRVGFTEPPGSLRALVVSYTAVSPLPPGVARRRSVFCGTIPRVAPGRRYRPPCPAEPGPSSVVLANQEPPRPPGQLARLNLL